MSPFLSVTFQLRLSPQYSDTDSVSSLVNDERTQRVGDLLADFRALQYSIAAAPTDCPHPEDYYTEGWAALRQCALDGQHILNVAADTHVPRGRTADEQNKVELQQ